MIYGPCGGVTAQGGCEVDGTLPCPFAGKPLVEWPKSSRPPARPDFAPLPSPWVVAELGVRARDRASIRRFLRGLNGACDAVLVGDLGAGKHDFPPSYIAGMVLEAGLVPWVVLSCRDRNNVALAAECAALADLGVGGVHCVTGDWVPAGTGQVFDLDSLRLVSLAADHGLRVSVAANPAAPPVSLRPARLASKAAAGASVCFVNYSGGPRVVAQFVGAATNIGVKMEFVPCVAVRTDSASSDPRRWSSGARLDEDGTGHAPVPGAGPAASTDAAVRRAERMLAIPGVVGVDLACSTPPGTEAVSAGLLAEVSSRLRGGIKSPPSPATSGETPWP